MYFVPLLWNAGHRHGWCVWWQRRFWLGAGDAAAFALAASRTTEVPCLSRSTMTMHVLFVVQYDTASLRNDDRHREPARRDAVSWTRGNRSA